MHFAWVTWPCKMERGTGLEPATICLEGRDSTTELPPLIPAAPNVEPGTGIEPVTSYLPRTRSTNVAAQARAGFPEASRVLHRKRGRGRLAPKNVPERSPRSQDRFGRRRRWWTGEDSNLRSPQGAADLQSAGFSHSPPRPAEPSGTRIQRPAILSGTKVAHPAKSSGHSFSIPLALQELDRTAVRGTPQCRKGSWRKTPALALLSRGIRPQPLPKILGPSNSAGGGI